MSNFVTSTSLGPQILEILGVKSDVVTDFQIFFEAGQLVTCSITRILTDEEGKQISSVLESYVLARLEDCEPEQEDCEPEQGDCDYD
jgi:hypothetical protein